MTTTPIYPVDTKIYVAGEKRPYKVQAADDRYVIATKTHFGTVLYTILDFVVKVRGPDNRVFSHGYETREDCEYNLRDLRGEEGPCQLEVTYRNRVPLDVRGADWEIVKVVLPDGTPGKTPLEILNQ